MMGNGIDGDVGVINQTRTPIIITPGEHGESLTGCDKSDPYSRFDTVLSFRHCTLFTTSSMIMC